jgi:hypothetical protein
MVHTHSPYCQIRVNSARSAVTRCSSRFDAEGGLKRSAWARAFFQGLTELYRLRRANLRYRVLLRFANYCHRVLRQEDIAGTS